MDSLQTASALDALGYVVHRLCDADGNHNHKVGGKMQPCRSPGKVPTRRGWQKANASDQRTIRPGDGIGVVTGSGLLVVDSDIDEEKNGERALVELYESNVGGMPPEPLVETGGGGYHRWYRVPDDLPTPDNTTGALGIGIDTRGDGGQVVVPPSPHASGNTYEWTNGLPPAVADLPVVPAWMLRMLRDKSRTGKPLSRNRRRSGGPIPAGERDDALNSALWHYGGKLFPLTLKRIEERAAELYHDMEQPPGDEFTWDDCLAKAHHVYNDLIAERGRTGAPVDIEMTTVAEAWESVTTLKAEEVESWERLVVRGGKSILRLTTTGGIVDFSNIASGATVDRELAHELSRAVLPLPLERGNWRKTRDRLMAVVHTRVMGFHRQSVSVEMQHAINAWWKRWEQSKMRDETAPEIWGITDVLPPEIKAHPLTGELGLLINPASLSRYAHYVKDPAFPADEMQLYERLHTVGFEPVALPQMYGWFCTKKRIVSAWGVTARMEHGDD